jgi:hypothetical protein
VPEPRSRSTSSRPEPAPAAAFLDFDWRGWIEPLRPDLSGSGIARLASRCTIAALSITILTALADWSARGFLDRGGLDRLVSMKPPPRPESRTALKPDRALDRGRLKAILAADSSR